MQIKHFWEKGNEKVNDMDVGRQKGIKQICKGHHLQIYRSLLLTRLGLRDQTALLRLLLCRQILGGKKPSEASADKKGEKIDPLQNFMLSIFLSGLSFLFQPSVLILFLLAALSLSFPSLSCSVFLTLSHMRCMEYDPRPIFFRARSMCKPYQLHTRLCLSAGC